MMSGPPCCVYGRSEAQGSTRQNFTPGLLEGWLRNLWDLWDPSWIQIWTSKIFFWFRFFFVALLKIGSGTRPHGRLEDSLILNRKHEMDESTNKQTNTVNEQIR